MSEDLTKKQSYISLLQTIEGCGGPEGLLKSLNPPTEKMPPHASEPTVAAPRGGMMKPVIYMRLNIKIVADLPWKDFYLLIISNQDDTLEGCGVGHLPGVVGATLGNADCIYTARPGITALLPPNNVTFKWVDAGADHPDLCSCEVYSNGRRFTTIDGIAAGEGALVGTYGTMHWVQKPLDA